MENEKEIQTKHPLKYTIDNPSYSGGNGQEDYGSKLSQPSCL
jgi:hypothetical protein